MTAIVRRANQRGVELFEESRVLEGVGELAEDAARRAEEQALDVCVLGLGQRMKGARLVEHFVGYDDVQASRIA